MMQPTGLSWRFGLFLALVGVGLGVQWWAATQWAGNFGGDEATVGLVARQILAGESTPVYLEGDSGAGTAEVWLAAAVLDSPYQFSSPVLALRLGNVLLFGVFVLLHGWLIYKLWGGEVALISTLLAAVPGAMVLWWTYRPLGAWGMLLVCGTAALLLSELNVQDGVVHIGRLLLLGGVMGLGVWSNRLMLVYLGVILMLWLLRTPEWRIIYLRVGAQVWPVAGVALLLLGGTALFTAACPTFTTLHTSAQIILLASVGWTAVGFGWVSQRNMSLLGQSIALGVGFAGGNFPQWWAFLANTEPIPPLLPPVCSTHLGVRVYQLATEVVPHLWGGVWGVAGDGWWWRVGAWAAVPLMLAAVLYFLWHWRYIWAAVFTLRPLAADDVKILLPVLLFVLPLALLWLNGSPLDSLATRHLLPMWQGGTVLMAWGVVRLAREWRNWAAVGLLLVVGYQLLGYIALANLWSQ